MFRVLRIYTYIDTQFETETMKAVPTPRLDVGENTFAPQLLESLVSVCVVYIEKIHSSHHQRKQAIKTSYDQKDSEVRCSYTLLRSGSEDDISD